MTNDVKISILIATRNRSMLLARLLDGLSSQVNAPPFEVIISDNGSTDDTAKVIERARDRLQINYISEERPGKSRALNTALKAAQCELIVFTDDDVIPQSDWLYQLYSASTRYPAALVFGGLIEINLEEVPLWIKRSYNLMGLLTSAHKLGEADMFYSYGQYPFGPNMGIRRSLLAGLNKPYPEHLGPGTAYPVGDESAFLMKFSLPGSQDRVFVSAAKVFHKVEAENVTFLSALRRCFLAGCAQKYIRLPVISRNSGKFPWTCELIAARLKSCKSLRELSCISVRCIGFLMGSKLLTKS